MNDIVVEKLKKYLLFISVLSFFLLWGHITYLYLYDGAKSEAQAGGTISEAIIGTFPHLNPLVPSNDHNAYINGLLYRSLLQYSPKTWNIETDLASCNTENLLYIECVLENNLEWSNKQAITPEDIVATLTLIRETKVNPILASLLEKTEIKINKNVVIFKNESKDINFLQVLLQPILPKTLIDTLTSETVDGKFSEIGWVYSGRFVLTSISQDETVGITRITLGKNESYFWNPLYIQFLILNLFRDEEHFLKNKTSFNIFNDKDGLVGDSIPRLQSFEYTLSQFVGSFFNTETLSLELRKFLISNIEREKLLDTLGDNKISLAYNPFLSSKTMDIEVPDFNLETYLRTKGYYSKKDLLKSTLLKEQESQKVEKEISAEVPVVPVKIIQQESLSSIVSPTTDKYNFVSEDNILIKGNVPAGVDAVYINDYKLSGFKSGDDVFFYRLLESYDSIKLWENTYTLSFESEGKKKEIESFTYIYETDTEKLETLKKNFFTKVEDIPKVTPEEVKKDSPAKIETSLTSEQIETLDDTLYYNASGEVFEIDLVYTSNDTILEQTAQNIKAQLSEKGISVGLTPSTLWDISVWLRNESLEYDILLIGVNLWYFGSNIFPYFHSSQVKNGYNFSNFKKLSLDILLEELTGNKLPISKQEELQSKILQILQEEAIMKVYYTPKIHLLVDKSIKNFILPQYLPDAKHRFFPLIDAYLSEKKSINKEDKWIIGFWIYLIKVLLS